MKDIDRVRQQRDAAVASLRMVMRELGFKEDFMPIGVLSISTIDAARLAMDSIDIEQQKERDNRNRRAWTASV